MPMHIKATAKRAWYWLGCVEDHCAILFLFTMVLLINLAIILRITIYFESASWEEIARFSMIWLFCLGGVVASREDSHVRMGFLGHRIHSATTRLIVDMAFDLICVVSISIFTMWSARFVAEAIASEEHSLQLMIGMWVVYSSFFIGGLLIVIHTLVHLINRGCKLLNLMRQV